MSASIHSVSSPRPARRKIPYLRWLIAFALFLAAVLNYIDRNVFGLLAVTIQKDLALSDEQYALILNFFFAAYTIAYLLSGRIADRLGVRLSLSLFIGWWSISNALTGLAHSVRSLCVYRFMLGLGEAGIWTVAPKVVSEWFPPAERGVAVGLYSVGGAAGATIAPIMVAAIASRYGWRWVFAVSPVLALLWLCLWLWLYRAPSRHPRITAREKEYLATNSEPLPMAGDPVLSERERWREVLRQPLVWQLMLARLLTDWMWFFYPSWLPKYLQTVRGVDQKGLSILWVVYLAADIGFLSGGFFSGWLIKRGSAPAAARLRIMLLSACVAPLMVFMPAMPSGSAVIALAMLVGCALTFWLGNLTALVVDVTPRAILGTAFGVIACGSTLGNIFMNEAVAWLIHYRSYNYCFYLMVFAHPLALLIVWSVGKRKPVISEPRLVPQS